MLGRLVQNKGRLLPLLQRNSMNRQQKANPLLPLSAFNFATTGPTEKLSVGVPKETGENEKRVALAPEGVTRLRKLGYTVNIESNAGAAASIENSMFEAVEAKIVSKQAALQSDIVLKVQAPTVEEIEVMKPESNLLSFMYPAQNPQLVDTLNKKKITSFAMDCVPRISRAQVFDALSSMAGIAGYKAIVEAANNFGRCFTGQITAAGRMPPAKVLVIGGGVAGLSAIATAKSLGAIVRGFDTRAAVKEQVESLGAQFLEVKLKEDGEGTGGYAKVMSKEFIEAEMKLFAQQAKEVDIIVTTALIPGKKAPLLINKETLELLKPGSVVVDLAAEAGGNCAFTEKGKIVEHNGVKILGFSDFPSRLPGQSSALYGNNISKLLESMTKEKAYGINLEDVVVRGAIVTHEGQTMWPDPNPPMLDAPKPKSSKVEVKVEQAVVDPWERAKKSQIITSTGLGSLIGFGVLMPQLPFIQMFSTFSLAVLVGYQSVWGVVPALHTPLMSITNAISGITAVGGLLILGGGFLPQTIPHYLAAIAVLVSTFNIVGGFVVTKRMLDMFKRPTDPPEYNQLYGIPAAVTIGGLLAAHMFGVPHIYQMGYLAASLCCIGGISGLAAQKTARMGNALGVIGISTGVVTALAQLQFPLPLFTQAIGCLGIAGTLGYVVGKRIGVTQLPQTVAIFHSLVGIAAVTTSIASFMLHPTADNLHKVACFLGTAVGAVTFTGSVAAFLKLSGLVKKGGDLPMKAQLNKPLSAISLLSAVALLASSNPAVGIAALVNTAICTLALGWNITNSIGAADMPVAITVLNSYSGWALCAEGFMLDNMMLTIVGSLIGSSGAILSYIMCKAMNRSLPNVIFGKYESLSSGGGESMKIEGEHVPTSVEEVGDIMCRAKKVIIVPGYGLAAAQGQYPLSQFVEKCTKNGVDVKFGIHPVAGRMPGQLNVILAEVGIPYDIVHELEDINKEFATCDLALVIGANDIVNSAALEDPNSPIAGMPVLEVWKAKNVVVMKRSMATGYADIQNPLFFKENTTMLFGGAKESNEKLQKFCDDFFEE